MLAEETPEISVREAISRIAATKHRGKPKPKAGTFDAGIETARPWTRELKNGDELRLTVYDWNGTKWLDIRRWSLHLQSGELRPSTKGIRLLPAHFDELIAAYADALEETPDLVESDEEQP